MELKRSHGGSMILTNSIFINPHLQFIDSDLHDTTVLILLIVTASPCGDLITDN